MSAWPAQPERHDLSDADLSDADLSNANLSEIGSGICPVPDLSGADLSGCAIWRPICPVQSGKINLAETSRPVAKLVSADLADANLAGIKVGSGRLGVSWWRRPIVQLGPVPRNDWLIFLVRRRWRAH